MNQTCSVYTWNGWDSIRCDRPVERDDKCGGHAAANDRRVSQSAERSAEARERRRAVEHEAIDRRAGDEALAAMERVHALLGGPFNPHQGTVAAADIRRALDGPA